MRLSHWIAALALGAVVFPPSETTSAEPWTPHDFAFQESASGFDFSPDGSRVVWAKSTLDWDDQERRSQLELTDLDTNETIQLTQGVHRASNPKWSPDGKLIAFLTDRPDPKAKGEEAEGPQIWLLRTAGGEAWPITKGERGVQDFEWSGSESIVFTATEIAANYEQELKEKKDTSAVLDDEAHEPPVRLYGVDIESGEVARLSKNTDWIQNLWLSPDGKYAVTVHAKSLRYEYDQKVGPEVRLWNLESDESERILPEFRHGVANLEWQPDSKGFYFAADFSTDPVYAMAVESRLYQYDMDGKKTTPIPTGTGRGLLFGIIEPHPKGVIALLEDGVRSKLALFTKVNGQWLKTELKGDHVKNIWGLYVSPDGKRMIYSYATANQPEQYFAAGLGDTQVTGDKAFSQLNPSLADRRFAKTEVVHWKGARDEEVEGILYYPFDYEAGKKYPLVLSLHGGPNYHDPDNWNDSWAEPIHLYCQRGAFVFKPNYHGSSGYGLPFAESIGHGNYYTLPLEDIEKGVQVLVDRGLADPEKLSSTGWSNGAILTIALVTKDTRFKAASVGAGGAEWTTDWGVCAFGQAFSNYYMGRAPIEDLELYRKNAPLNDFEKVRTPTIFFHGTEDTSVPTFHSLSMYHTLQYIGKAATRLVLFPGEPHGIGKPAHRLRKIEEELAWFDRYLFGKPVPENAKEAIRSGSGLSELIELLKAKRVDGRCGESAAGILAPEVVEFSGLQVGRFEVTRAQFAAFDPNYRFEPGTDDFPASGIPAERAQAYCKWLSQKLGRTFRLPNQEEGERLYGEGASGNTLDVWAGYAVNPEDAVRLREELKKLPAGALVRKVGRPPGSGSANRVYDLGGNVAEWVVLKDGKIVPMGGSADTPEDPSSDLEPGPAYIGLRVVREAPTK